MTIQVKLDMVQENDMVETERACRCALACFCVISGCQKCDWGWWKRDLRLAKVVL